jgi:catechol-2,3-dioxygenase
VEHGAIEHPRGLTRGFCELTLEARDPAVLAEFYAEVFGWSELPTDEDDRIWLACGERSRLGLWSRGPKEFGDEGGRHVHFALSIRPGQLDQLVAALRRRDVSYEGPVEHDGGDRSLYFDDPEGNVVEAWDFFEHGEGARGGVDALA